MAPEYGEALAYDLRAAAIAGTVAALVVHVIAVLVVSGASIVLLSVRAY